MAGNLKEFVHNYQLSGKGLERHRDLQRIIYYMATQPWMGSSLEVKADVPVEEALSAPDRSFFYDLIAEMLPEEDLPQYEASIQAIEKYGLGRIIHAETLKKNPESLTKQQVNDIYKDFLNFQHLFNLVSDRSRDNDDEVVKEKITRFCLEYMDHHYDEVMVKLLHDSIMNIHSKMAFALLEGVIRRNWRFVAETRQKSDTENQAATSAS